MMTPQLRVCEKNGYRHRPTTGNLNVVAVVAGASPHFLKKWVEAPANHRKSQRCGCRGRSHSPFFHKLSEVRHRKLTSILTVRATKLQSDSAPARGRPPNCPPISFDATTEAEG